MADGWPIENCQLHVRLRLPKADLGLKITIRRDSAVYLGAGLT